MENSKNKNIRKFPISKEAEAIGNELMAVVKNHSRVSETADLIIALSFVAGNVLATVDEKAGDNKASKGFADVIPAIVELYKLVGVKDTPENKD